MTDSRAGKVVTFYSYKGGTGRTMALANVAWILAANGKRVLAVDWNLDSPGLHRYFAPFANGNAFAASGGVIDLIQDYQSELQQRNRTDGNWHEEFARVDRRAFPLNWDAFPAGGALDLLTAGRQDRNYVERLTSVNWDNFYARLGGGLFIDALRQDMKRQYDYTLIDSRTGHSDIADICTVYLPDTLVACFTLSGQGVDGAAEISQTIRDRYRARNIRILPVAMRVDPAGEDKVDAGRVVAKHRFAGLPETADEAERERYWAAMHVPYQPFYAFEETLATFGDQPGMSGSLLRSYELLTGWITDGEVTSMPVMPDAARRGVLARFTRKPAAAEEEVTLRYAPQDQVWAEWIEQVLINAGLRVNDPANAREGGPVPSSTARPLVLVSHANRAGVAESVGKAQRGLHPPLVVYVADVQPLSRLPLNDAVRLVSLTKRAAAEKLLRLVRMPGADVDTALAGAPRFPGSEPAVFNPPARNTHFTGRENELRQLRAALRTGDPAQSRPVTLLGMGGIGKTQIATEYVVRFRCAYDVVWWVDADPPSFVGAKLSDLAPDLQLPAHPNPADTTRAVLQALGRGEPYRRWLLVLDNADDVAAIEPYLPRTGGHILVTSSDQSWAERATAIQVDVFSRTESVSHLTGRVRGITAEEADRIADALGDLPIAVASAGAWLAETGTAVDDYLEQIELHGPKALEPSEVGPGRRVEATWDLSLQRLHERSPAAYRLLQMCSLLAPEIALPLLYSEPFAGALIAIEPRVSDRMFRGSLVQALTRLTLVKMGQHRWSGGEMLHGERPDRVGHIVVHRLLRQVVRYRMTAQEQKAIRHQLHLILAACRPEEGVDDPDTWPRYRMLWPHLETSEATEYVAESVRKLFIDRVRYLYLFDELEPGLGLAEQIEATWRDRLGQLTGEAEIAALRRELLLLRFNQANILRACGRFPECYELDAAGLAEQEVLLGREHPHTLMSAGGLAGDLRALGRYREALELDERTYAAWAEGYGEEHERTLTALSNLAVSHRLMGRFRTALELDRRAYRGRQAVLRPDHSNTLISAGAIGRDLRDAGQFEESVDILADTVKRFRRVWGSDARGSLLEQANLSVSLREMGRAREAVEPLDKSVERLAESFGMNSPDTLSVRHSRAMNYLALGDTVAVQEMRAVCDAYVGMLGASHPKTLACLNNLALAKRANHDPAGALGIARDASDRLGGVLDANHPRVLGATINLAVCCAEVGELDEAVELAATAADGMRERLGPEHPDTLCAQADHVLIRRMAGVPGLYSELAVVQNRLALRLGERHPAAQAVRRGDLLPKIIDPHPF